MEKTKDIGKIMQQIIGPRRQSEDTYSYWYRIRIVYQAIIFLLNEDKGIDYIENELKRIEPHLRSFWDDPKDLYIIVEEMLYNNIHNRKLTKVKIIRLIEWVESIPRNGTVMRPNYYP